MTPKQIAREKVIAAALSLVSCRVYTDVSAPGPHDDANLEMYDDMLDDALNTYMTIDIEG